MKNLTLIFALSVLISCSNKEEAEKTNLFDNLSYTLDTVVVDAGEELVVLNYGLGPYSLSEDRSHIYFYEREPFNLVEVDLNQLKLLKKTPFEKEGPNGTGPYLVGMNLSSQNQIFVYGYNAVGIFDQNARKVQDLKFVPEGVDEQLANDFNSMFNGARYDFAREKIYSQPRFENSKTYEFFVLDPKSKKGKSFPIPNLKIVTDLSRTMTIDDDKGRAIYFYAPQSFTTQRPEEVFLSVSAMSGFYRYDTKNDTLSFVDIQHQSQPNKMDSELLAEPTDMESMEAFQRKMEEHINYDEIHWDDTRQLYLRLGRKTFRGETREEPTKFEMYLFAYDKDFRVIGETKLEGLNQPFYGYFLKDGKLWSYVNVEDELGFAVMDLKF